MGTRVAMCAVETDAEPGDIYLDDADHYALAAKFSRDRGGVEYPEEWAAMDTQKRRDARDEMDKWLKERDAELQRVVRKGA